MHRPFDVAQRRASQTNAGSRKVREAAGKIEKNLTPSMRAVPSAACIQRLRRVAGLYGVTDFDGLALKA